MKILSIEKLCNDLEKIIMRDNKVDTVLYDEYYLRTGLGTWLLYCAESVVISKNTNKTAELEEMYTRYKAHEKRREISKHIIQQINECRGSFGGTSFTLTKEVFGGELFEIIKDYFKNFIKEED